MSSPNASLTFKMYGKFLAFEAFLSSYLQIVGTNLLKRAVSLRLFSLSLSYSFRSSVLVTVFEVSADKISLRPE